VTVIDAPPLAPSAVEPIPGWSIRGATLSSGRPLVIGILNLTPDSFSDGGDLPDADAALRRAERMVREGADLLDLGGESTRPGAEDVDAAEQCERVVPALERIRREFDLPLSIDTRSAAVAREAIAAGAAIVNDVSALSDREMGEVVRESGAGVVLMHMRGTPRTMSGLADYGDVVAEVRDELVCALQRALDAGIAAEAVVLDPGIGFAKETAHNLALLGAVDRLAPLGRPILVGPSRKRFLGEILGGLPPAERVFGTVGACVAALMRGARLFRVHDVGPVRQALDVADAIRRTGSAQR
jgi:dihydropteroate synthase